MSTHHLPLSSDSQPEDNQKVIHLNPDTDLNQIFQKTNTSNFLGQLLMVEERLREKIKEKLIAPDPLVTQANIPIFFPNSIMVIQGQSGVHKSRVAENICSTLIMHSTQVSYLGYHRFQEKPCHIIFADTERNLNYQFPAAIQKMYSMAGFYPNDVKPVPEYFHFTSLIEVERHNRFEALESYIKYKRSIIDGSLVVILDVITDCVPDFNRPDGSLKLIDMMNKMINEADCSFICVIHENPGSDKARGHLGTEIYNKATTVLQVGFVKQNGQSTDVVELKYLKSRTTKKPESMFAKYSDEFHTLVLLDDDSLAEIKRSIGKQLAVEETAENLEILFQEKMIYTNKEITVRLMEMLDAKKEAIRKRLIDVMTKNWVLNIGQYQYHLTKIQGKRSVEFTITPVQKVTEE
jgi:hypothetical protein